MESQLSGWWVADVLATSGPVMLFSWVVWVILSICLHELGHGIAAIRLGDNTPRELGRMTMDPLVHMGGFSLIIFAVIGFAWGAMPVDPTRLRHKYGEAIVAAAGPAVNLLLAILCVVLLGLWLGLMGGVVSEGVYESVATVLRTGAGLNILLMMLNLLPVPPLDGSKILANFSYQYRNAISNPNAALFGMIFLFIIVFRASGPVVGWTWDKVDSISFQIGWAVGLDEHGQEILQDALRDALGDTQSEWVVGALTMSWSFPEDASIARAALAEHLESDASLSPEDRQRELDTFDADPGDYVSWWIINQGPSYLEEFGVEPLDETGENQ
ncbi:MAG: site-2 protease family protein [Phycisphaerales bacterium JB043]